MEKILKLVIKLLCETSYLYITSDVQNAARTEMIAQASCDFRLDREFDIELAGFLCSQE